MGIMLEAMRGRNEGTQRRGGKADIRDHCLSRRAVRAKTSYELSWEAKGIIQVVDHDNMDRILRRDAHRPQNTHDGNEQPVLAELAAAMQEAKGNFES